MAEREGFVFYRSFYDAIKNMDDATCAACFRALCEYGLNGVETAENPIAAAILIMAKPNIDKNNQKYENGKKGGRPKKQKEETENQSETEEKPNENQTETKTEKAKPKEKETEKAKPKEKETEKAKPKEKEKETEKDTLKSVSEGVKPSAFAPPSVEEVREYCEKRGNKVDAERFVDYYTANGWVYGKTLMKDWKAVVRNWEKQDAERVEGQSGVRQQGASAQPKQNRFCNYTPSYTPEKLAEVERLDREQRLREIEEERKREQSDLTGTPCA